MGSSAILFFVLALIVWSTGRREGTDFGFPLLALMLAVDSAAALGMDVSESRPWRLGLTRPAMLCGPMIPAVGLRYLVAGSGYSARLDERIAGVVVRRWLQLAFRASLALVTLLQIPRAIVALHRARRSKGLL